MRITTHLNYLHMAPRKVRLVANAIRGKRVPEAERTLSYLTRRSALPLLKLLRSGVANARENFRIPSSQDLVIAEMSVNAGPTLKRSRPRAFGRAFSIGKRTSHVTLTLESRGAPPRRPKPKRGGMRVVTEAVEGVPAPVLARPQEREAFRVRPKAAPKPMSFVRRMFRRKAI